MIYPQYLIPQALYFLVIFFTISIKSLIFIFVFLYYIMKNICDWNNCKKIGEYRAQLKKIIVKNLAFMS